MNGELVGERIRSLLEKHAVTAIVCSAACGADLLALREAASLGIRRKVVLPYDRELFKKTSVLDRPGDWRFYDGMIDQVAANQDLITLAAGPDDEAAYTAANQAILENAQILGRADGEEVRSVLIWDGKSRGVGDLTEAFGSAARQQGISIMEVFTLRTCFVVQGFGEKTDLSTGRVLNLDASYEVVKEAVEEAGLRCTRADEIIHSGTIDKPMYEWIYSADLVIADLSTYNVNAAYELGVRYGVRPGLTMILAENQFKNPFDVSHIVTLPYEHLGKDIGRREAARLKQVLIERITKLLSGAAVDSPVYTFLPLQPPSESSEHGRSQDKELAAASVQPEATQSARELLQDARAAMAAESFLEAKASFKAIRKLLPRDVYVVQQLALATYKSKSPDKLTSLQEARGYLKELDPQVSNDPETLGLWGAVHKRLWELTKDRGALDISIDAYERGFYLKQDYYNGINYAFLLNARSVLYESERNTPEAVADFVLARRARRTVMKFCESALTGLMSDEAKYWIIATMWEAAVGVGDQDAAERYRAEAEKLSQPGWMLETTNEQLAKLRELLAASPFKNS
jgi:hypothetical protein